jgi:peptidoglycan/xylan/chitin deacetylase (PgdA/CDA1 family)
MSSTWPRLARRAVIGAVAEAVGAARTIRPDPTARILLYHRIEPAPRTHDLWSVSVAAFERQMQLLRASGYRVVGHDTLKGADGSARPSAMLAFDDGYASAYEHALPILRRLGLEATFFLVPSALGRSSDWERGSGVDPTPLMRWDDVQGLLAAGMRIGAHSWSHADLTRLDDAALESEVVRAKQELEGRLGRRIDAFSVPYGRDDPRLDPALRRAGYLCKVTNQETSPSDQGGLLVWPCTAVLNGDSLRTFRLKLRGAYDWLSTYRRLRKRLARQ